MPPSAWHGRFGKLDRRMQSPKQSAVILTIALLFLTHPLAAAAANECDTAEPPDCSCGRLAVCVFSNHPEGYYSELYGKHPSSWEGFGQNGADDFGAAMQVESDVAQALAAEYPCLDVVPMDSYVERVKISASQMEESGLKDRINQAKASGDAAALAQLKQESEALLKKWGADDFPWENEEAGSAQVGGRTAMCLSTVMLSGSANRGSYRIDAKTSVPIGQTLDNATAYSSSKTPYGAVDEVAKRVAGQLQDAYEELFCSCQSTTVHCITENFEMSNRSWRCDSTRKCCGEVVEKWSERGAGLRAGGGTTREKVCCSPLARTREGKGDPEDKAVADQIWCPGTWNLWVRDFDCDGVPNAKDASPMP